MNIEKEICDWSQGHLYKLANAGGNIYKSKHMNKQQIEREHEKFRNAGYSQRWSSGMDLWIADPRI